MKLIDAGSLIEFIDMGRYRNPLELSFSERDVVDMIESRSVIEAIPVEYLMEKAMESREVEKRHRCDYLGNLAGQTADIIEGIILKWRGEDAKNSDD